MNTWFEALIAWSGPMLAGALITVEMAVSAYAIALVIGLLGASAKLQGNPVLSAVATTYSTLMRAVPELLLVILLYYAGQELLNAVLQYFGVSGSVGFSGLITAISVLALVEGAYLTEIFRAAIQSIPRGHIEAADAYGMSRWLRLRRIVLPEMLPVALPSMYNMWLILLKDTALVSVVGAQELFFTTQQAAASTRAYFLFYAAAGAIYLLLTMSSNVGFRWLEQRMSRGRAAV